MNSEGWYSIDEESLEYHLFECKRFSGVFAESGKIIGYKNQYMQKVVLNKTNSVYIINLLGGQSYEGGYEILQKLDN